MNPSIEQIIKMYLMENGYDGLYNSEGECACELSDLFPLLIFWGITSGYRKHHKKINHALYPYSSVQEQLDQFDLYRNHKN